MECGLNISECLLELQLTSVNEIKVLKTTHVFKVENCIQDHHIHMYKNVWTSFIGEELTCTRGIENMKDPFAIAVGHFSTVIDHVP